MLTTYLTPLQPLDAFRRNTDLLLSLQKDPATLQSASLVLAVMQNMMRLVREAQDPHDAERVLEDSLSLLAWGLTSGTWDGASLYLEGRRPLRWEDEDELFSELADSLQASLGVADGEWRTLDSDELQLRAGYGKHLNRQTHLENLQFLSQGGRTRKDVQRAYLETFRTGYNLGLIDAAIVFLLQETPEAIQ